MAFTTGKGRQTHSIVKKNVMKKPHISIVTPVYGCAECLNQLYERLVASIVPITNNFEILMVNDASPDNSWDHITDIASKDERVKGINLSRNFGQHHAITAGLDFTSGDWVVVMDCDLQDQPEEILKLYQKAQEGFDVVFGARSKRHDSFLKKLGSNLFSRILSYLVGQTVDSSIANFSIIAEKVVLEFRRMREKSRDYSLLVFWIGYNKTKIEINHSNRPFGKSSYSLKKLIYLAYDIIIAHSNKPLRLSISFGFIISMVSFLFGLYLILRYFYLGVPVAGWTSVMVSVYFIGGLLFANMGILGLYIGKIFNENKNRPIYVIGETLNILKD